MKTKCYTVPLITLALLLTGCASYQLPAINAAELSYRRTDPVGGSEVKAKNVRVTEESVTAEEASWNTTYPSWSIAVTIKGYERKLKPQEKSQ